ncbi:MAG: D-tyrosyl-tRNA(Tyr) deacylase [Lachnospiraceae bacterium]|nr:D-tyrosyl-tRNA(Tyr) deacylase [Lachnospiraceae bacterium]
MKLVVQRTDFAQVSVEGEIKGKIGRGFLVLIGIGLGDTREAADRLARKLTGLRIFPDEQGRTNLSLREIGGGILAISQFTLYADCRKGYRPSFTQAAPPDQAEALYLYFVEKLRESGLPVETGVFGAHMDVTLRNNGPFTVILED